MCMFFSKNLLMVQSIVMGLKLVHSDLFPAFWIRVTLPVFHLDGNSSAVMLIFSIVVIDLDKAGGASFKSLGDTPSIAVVLCSSRSPSSLMTFSSEI